MASSTKLLKRVCSVLSERSFSPAQIEKLVPKLHQGLVQEPELLGDIVDAWNRVMGQAVVNREELGLDEIKTIPASASPPRSGLIAKLNVNMPTILADVEPDLLLLDPEKLVQRHENIKGLGIVNNLNEHWIMLFNAPRGLYLQDWQELTRKVYYIEHQVMDLLYDKKEQREMTIHPLVKSAAVTEADFNHIRARYLFALRTGFRELSHMYRVQTALTRPKLKDLILLDDASYLQRFAPYCSDEEYSCFSNLIKNYDLEGEDDAEVAQHLAELDSVRHPRTVNKRFADFQRAQRE